MTNFGQKEITKVKYARHDNKNSNAKYKFPDHLNQMSIPYSQFPYHRH